jgi:hypothetical protein
MIVFHTMIVFPTINVFPTMIVFFLQWLLSLKWLFSYNDCSVVYFFLLMYIHGIVNNIQSFCPPPPAN